MNIQLADTQYSILAEDQRQKLKLLFEAISIEQNHFSFEIKDDGLEKNESDSELEDEIFFLVRLHAPFLSDLKVDYTIPCTIKYQWEHEDTPEILEAAIYCHRKLNNYYDDENNINIPQEILDRDAEKRDNWHLYKSAFNNLSEARWQEKFFEDTEKYLPGFHYLYDFQWEPVPGHNDFGQNDLILTDGCGCFAVVEVKFISPSNSEDIILDKLHKVDEQAKKYRDLFLKANRDDINVLTVIGVTFTNQDDGTVGFVDDFDENIAYAIKYNRRLNRVSASSIDSTVNNPNLTFEDGRLKYSRTKFEKREKQSGALRKSMFKKSADDELGIHEKSFLNHDLILGDSTTTHHNPQKRGIELIVQNLCDWDREMKQEVSRLEAIIQKQSERERELYVNHVNEIEEIQQRNEKRFEKQEKRRNKLQDEIQRQEDLVERLQQEKKNVKQVLMRKIDKLQQKVELLQGNQTNNNMNKKLVHLNMHTYTATIEFESVTNITMNFDICVDLDQFFLIYKERKVLCI
ncbi:329_t:CDS:2 [Ambispora gerdemannii]|uniref:329_t:CDS:1 n=1 Tax=Ambispora gerdemannii TaxID=144530 RepID=A0A9N9C478_9GLOM|nr:329_t:CDS:2 [Ambispora gerdemannii]